MHTLDCIEPAVTKSEEGSKKK